MKRLTNVFLSSILQTKVYDEFDDNIGKLIDIYVTAEEGYPRVIGYMIKKDGEIFNYEFRSIALFEGANGKVLVNVKGVRKLFQEPIPIYCPRIFWANKS